MRNQVLFQNLFTIKRLNEEQVFLRHLTADNIIVQDFNTPYPPSWISSWEHWMATQPGGSAACPRMPTGALVQCVGTDLPRKTWV
jgi:hypothetical protein